MSSVDKRIAIIASSIHPVRQNHLVEWYKSISKEKIYSQLFIGSRNKAIPIAKNYKLNSKKDRLKHLLTYPSSFYKLLKNERLLPLETYKPDLIHLLTSNTFPQIKDYIKKSKCKLIVSFRGYDINVFPYLSLANKSSIQETFEQADILHFISEGLMKNAINLGAKPEKCVIIKRAAPVFQTKARIKKGNKIVILTVARLVWEKGYIYALDTIKILIEKGFDIEYRIVGDGVDINLLQYHRERLGLEDVVHFLGQKNREEVAEEYSKADIYFQPSLTEALSVSIIEASSMGLPVVATRVGGIPEVVLDNISGFLSKACDAKDHAEKLEQLISDSQLRKEFGTRGKEYINKEFNEEKLRREWIALYENLLK